MATGINPSLIERNRQHLFKTGFFHTGFGRRLINGILRRVCFGNNHSYAGGGIKLSAFGGRLTKGYACIDGCLSDDFVNFAVRNWPAEYFFATRGNVAKLYFSSDPFLFQGMNIDHWLLARKFRFIKDFANEISSDEFLMKLREFVGDNVERKPYSLTVTWLKGRSSLLPHKDSVSLGNCEWSKSFINLIFFVAGSQLGRDGGTSIYADNTFQRPLLELSSVNNKVLVYNSSGDFYHGFPETDQKAWRMTFNVQFCSEQE